MKSIRETAMLVHLTISSWTGKAADRKVTKQIHEQHHAAKDSGIYIKKLIDEKRLNKVNKFTSALRKQHYEQTLPWDNTGRRLLPSANYFEYMTAMKKIQYGFETEVESLIKDYHRLIEDAKINLNGMFNSDDYPSEFELRDKYGVKLNVYPIEDSDDFRVKISESEVAEIRANIESSVKENLARATQSIFERVKEVLVAMFEKLAVQDAVFRDSLITNIKNLVELMPKLNVTDDPRIAALCEDMKSLLFEPDALRDNPNVRAKTALSSMALMKKYGIITEEDEKSIIKQIVKS